jgi:hypothetical protein
MRNFSNPLDNIKIASPCAADWNEMHGNTQKRFCGECKLNVYNLSAMTRQEAENLLMNSEGRLCVRFYRRADGTILTQNCPVGWAKVKQRVSRIATAAFSLAVGFFSGISSFNFLKPAIITKENIIVESSKKTQNDSATKDQKKGPSFGGPVSNSNELLELIFRSRR